MCLWFALDYNACLYVINYMLSKCIHMVYQVVVLYGHVAILVYFKWCSVMVLKVSLSLPKFKCSSYGANRMFKVTCVLIMCLKVVNYVHMFYLCPIEFYGMCNVRLRCSHASLSTQRHAGLCHSTLWCLFVLFKGVVHGLFYILLTYYYKYPWCVQMVFVNTSQVYS